MRFLTTALLLIVMLVFGLNTPVSADNQYGYAYLTFTHDSQVQMNIIVQVDGHFEVSQHALNLPENFKPFILPRFFSVSPTGEWVAMLIYQRGVDTQMQLTNMLSGETRIIAERLTFPGSGQNMTWSDDGRLFAFNAGINSRQIDANVYDVESNQLINLSNDLNDNEDQYLLAWSSNARYLSTFIGHFESCAVDCVLTLQLWDVELQQKATELRINRGGVILNTVCNLSSSPSGRFVTFDSNCNVSSGLASELMLWDTSQNVVTQITNFFPEANEMPFGIDYKIHWIDEEALIIGADYIFQRVSGARILHYDVESATTSIIANDLSLWTVHPVTRNLVVHSRNIMLDRNATEEDFIGEALEIRLDVSTELSLAQNSASIPNVQRGFREQWIPGTHTLVYPLETLAGAIESVVFLNLEDRTQLIYETNFADDPNINKMIPLGIVLY